ncbi:MAG TPA: mechanosensitive ion channel [Hyphomonadaceae bacterium]|nr:mechanosensitive ion channel [Hyphomonadaceae bacterium]HPN06242.1 mechanosensitive ion channel [Hyphomonadaceae bacterium]
MNFEEAFARVASDPLLVRVGMIVAILIVATVLIRMLQSMVGRGISDQALRYRVRKGISFIGYIAAVFAAFAAFSDSWGELVVVFGVAGAGVAFALQEVIASVAGWAALSFGAFYRPGDRVKLGGIVGDVIDVGVLRTTLMETGDWVAGDLYNGRIVRVANSFVFKEPVFNYSADFPFLWDEFKLPIRYGSDWRKAEEILTAAATRVTDELVRTSETRWERFVEKYLIEKARVAPLITMVTTGDWIEFTVRYITNYKGRRTSKDAICRLVLEGLEANADKIVLGAATFEILGVSERALRSMPDEMRNEAGRSPPKA